jgi:hypothetical protein
MFRLTVSFRLTSKDLQRLKRGYVPLYNFLIHLFQNSVQKIVFGNIPITLSVGKDVDVSNLSVKQTTETHKADHEMVKT